MDAGRNSAVGRGRPRETSHAEIRDAARELFATHGFDNVSVAQIADALGIGRTTLYAYFPNKRDLMWEEFDARVAEMRASFDDDDDDDEEERGILAMMRGAIRIVSRYSTAEHAAFAQRHRIMNDSAELRAHTALRTTELAHQLVQLGQERAPSVDPGYIGDLTHALMAVAARAIDEWASGSPDGDLDDYVDARLGRFLDVTATLRGSGT